MAKNTVTARIAAPQAMATKRLAVASILMAASLVGCNDSDQASAANDSAAAPASLQAETNVNASTGTNAVVREDKVDREPECRDCGKVVAVTAIDVKGGSTGAGAVIGAIAGGVIGHQFGSGSGNDAATAGGAVGGAVAGNEVERNRNSRTEYDVTVALDNGGSRTIRVTQLGSLNSGDRVRVSGNSVIEVD